MPVKGKSRILPDTDADADFSLRGKIVDEGMQPVAGAVVMLAGTDVRTQTNQDGFFLFHHIKSKKATVIISSVGYESKTVVLNAEDSTVVPIVSLTSQVSGEVVVITAGLVRVEQKKALVFPLLQKTKAEPSFSKFAVYPNPAASGTTIAIDVLKIKNGSYQLAIVNELGLAVQRNEILFDKGVKRVAITLKEIPAGQYFVQLTHRLSEKAYTEALVVQ